MSALRRSVICAAFTVMPEVSVGSAYEPAPGPASVRTALIAVRSSLMWAALIGVVVAVSVGSVKIDRRRQVGRAVSRDARQDGSRLVEIGGIRGRGLVGDRSGVGRSDREQGAVRPDPLHFVGHAFHADPGDRDRRRRSRWPRRGRRERCSRVHDANHGGEPELTVAPTDGAAYAVQARWCLARSPCTCR